MCEFDEVRDILGDGVSEDSLSLSGLSPLFRTKEERAAARARVAAGRKLREEYERKYGDKWMEVYELDMGLRVDYDTILKSINEAIYHGTGLGISGYGPTVHKIHERFLSRMHELYGDAFDELRYHANVDPRVVALLLEDAVRTGKWKELPDELQDEYHKRVGGSL